MMVFRDKHDAIHCFVDGKTDDVDTLRRHYCVALNLLESAQATLGDLMDELQAARAQIAGE